MLKVHTSAATSANPDAAEVFPGLQDGTSAHYRSTRQDNGPPDSARLLDGLSANLNLLLIGPVAAGLIAFAIVSFLPNSYTSAAYLNLDEAGAQAAAARMRSIPLIDRVLSGYDAPGTTVEAQRRYIESNTRIVVAPGMTPVTARLYRLEYSDRSPAIARTVNGRLLDAWLESTKPGLDERAATGAEIQRLDTQARAAASIIGELESDAQDSALRLMRGALAEMIVSLSIRQEETLARLAALRNRLKGVSRDVVVGEPTLPEEPSWPNRGVIVILIVAATSLLLPVSLVIWFPLCAFMRNLKARPGGGSRINP